MRRLVAALALVGSPALAGEPPDHRIVHLVQPPYEVGSILVSLDIGTDRGLSRPLIWEVSACRQLGGGSGLCSPSIERRRRVTRGRVTRYSGTRTTTNPRRTVSVRARWVDEDLVAFRLRYRGRREYDGQPYPYGTYGLESVTGTEVRAQ